MALVMDRVQVTVLQQQRRSAPIPPSPRYCDVADGEDRSSLATPLVMHGVMMTASRQDTAQASLLPVCRSPSQRGWLLRVSCNCEPNGSGRAVGTLFVGPWEAGCPAGPGGGLSGKPGAAANVCRCPDRMDALTVQKVVAGTQLKGFTDALRDSRDPVTSTVKVRTCGRAVLG